MKVVVLTTSYPRHERDVAGLFVRDAVEAVRGEGVEVEVVSPASFPHFGIAYGHGIVGNLRRRPWLVLLLPAFLVSFALAARRAARDADLVHAHWLPSGLAALATGKPYVVQLWGTDVEIARRAPWLFRPILRRARLAIAASESLADAARELGAREVRVIPSGVEIPESVGEPEEPPHVLFVGRLSPEKGIHEFLAATEGLPRVIVGAGPIRVPEAVGFVPHCAARAVLRARSRRLRPVAARGLRLRRARGDGLRPPGGRDGGRRARRRDRGRRDGPACGAGRRWRAPEALNRLLASAELRDRRGSGGSHPRLDPVHIGGGCLGLAPGLPAECRARMNRRALITGIGGQDGSLLAELLLGQDYDVFGVVRQVAPESYPNLDGIRDRIDLMQADLLDERSLVEALETSQPHEVYNLASPSFVPMSWEQPVLTAEFAAVGATALLQAVRSVVPEARVYQAASSEIFGEPLEAPQTEDTPVAPLTPYGAAKAYAFFIVRSYRRRYGLHASSGILYNHESPRRPLDFLPRKVANGAARISLGLDENLLLGDLDARRDWGFAGDYVRAMWLMLQQDEPDDYVISTGVTHSVEDLVQSAFEHVGLDWRDHVRVDESLRRGRAELHNLVGDSAKARERLGWEPTTDFVSLVRMLVDADVAHLSAAAGRTDP